jgi:predicted nucleotidyltransferase
MLTWSDRETVEQALRQWLVQEVGHHPELVRLGYFGSYARSDWGVGSDLDLIAIVHDTDKSFEHRALTWNLNVLPVPTELLVYTQKEWEKLMRECSRFAETISREAVWIYP